MTAPAEDGRIAANIMHFGRALRATGLPIGPGKVLDAIHAVEAVGLDRRQDFYWALRLRLTGETSSPQTRAELSNLSRLIVAVLADPARPKLHLIGYSDGHLLVEEALRRSLPRLQRALPDVDLERLLRERVFVEAWGNASPPLARGPRRLLVHDRLDGITSKKLPGGRTSACSRPASCRRASPRARWS